MQADIKRAVDIAERAANGWVVEHTDFYTPPLVADVLANTKKLAGLEVGCLSKNEWLGLTRNFHAGMPERTPAPPADLWSLWGGEARADDLGSNVTRIFKQSSAFIAAKRE